MSNLEKLTQKCIKIGITMDTKNYFPTKGMTKKQIKNFHINRAKEKFGEKFDYSKVGNISRASDEVVITCPKHGDMKTSFSSHLENTTGCPKCGKESSAKNRRLTHTEFVDRIKRLNKGVDLVFLNKYTHNRRPMYIQDKYGIHKITANSLLAGAMPTIRSAINKTEYTINRFIEKHGGLYDYSLFKYEKAKSDSIIICRKHGKFRRNPNDHLNGCGCPRCRVEKSRERILSNTEEFIKKANPVHKGFFSYDKVDYKGAKEMVTITCPLHGDFEQTPNSHLHGYGCYNCSRLGFKRDELNTNEAKKISCSFYLIKLSNKDETLYKVGISRRIKKRFYDLENHGFNLEKVKIVETNLLNSVRIESKILKEFTSFKYRPVTKMHGYTECFGKDLPVDKVIKFIEKANLTSD